MGRVGNDPPQDLTGVSVPGAREPLAAGRGAQTNRSSSTFQGC